jgi:uncharacterized protein YdhG (YjbR/CyaY superfamily)
MKKPTNTDEYIASFPAETQKQLQEIRAIIKKAAPKAEEVISYGMPGYKQHGMLVWFAGYAQHIGFYPSGSGIEAFKDQITAYKNSKGAVQFPLGKPLPKKLITDMVKFRAFFDAEIAAVKEMAKAAKKAAKKEASAEAVQGKKAVSVKAVKKVTSKKVAAKSAKKAAKKPKPAARKR